MSDSSLPQFDVIEACPECRKPLSEIIASSEVQRIGRMVCTNQECEYYYGD